MKDVTKKWTRVVQRSLTNLNVLTVDGKDVGFVYKPLNSKHERNSWRVHLGLGNDTQFMGHTWNLTDAKRLLEAFCVGDVRGYNN